MEAIFLSPNFAYLALVAGFLLAVMAILTPGTGLFEIGALFALVLAGWAMYNLPVNLWALLLLAVSLPPLILAVRKKGGVVYLLVSILAMVIGSAFLFRGQTWWQPAVHPLLAGLVSILAAVSLWFAARKVIETSQIKPAHSMTDLVGTLGEAKSEIHAEGAVQVDGELWSARSEQPIPIGSQVRVVGREGFILLVESTNQRHA